MDNDTEKKERFEIPEETSVTEKDGCCNAAVRLAVIGIIAGLFIPFIGITFALAGFYVNYAESSHHETARGYKMNAVSIIISVLSWVLAIALKPLIT